MTLPGGANRINGWPVPDTVVGHAASPLRWARCAWRFLSSRCGSQTAGEHDRFLI